MAEGDHPVKGRAIAIGTTSAGAGGLLVGIFGANSDAANKLLTAITSLFGRLDPNVAMLSIFFAAVCAGCWARTSQLRFDLGNIYALHSRVNAQLSVLLDRTDRRRSERDVEEERRAP